MVVLASNACGVCVLYSDMRFSEEHPGLVELRNIQWDDDKQDVAVDVYVQGRYVQSSQVHIVSKKQYFHRKLKGFPLI